MNKDINFIKMFKSLTSSQLSALQAWLRCESTAKEFFTDNFRACAWNDFDFFNKTTDRKHLVMPNEIMLIDRDVDGEHWLMVCRVGKNPSKTKVTHLNKVIKISEIRNVWKSGYWLIPKFNIHG